MNTIARVLATNGGKVRDAIRIAETGERASDPQERYLLPGLLNETLGG